MKARHKKQSVSVKPKEKKTMAREKVVETDATIGDAQSAETAGKLQAKAEKVKKVKEPKVKAEPKPKMFQAWGETFRDFGAQGEEAVKAEMLRRFPDRADTINKWTGWYRNFYNMGRIKGFENPERVVWLSEKKKAIAAKRAEREIEKTAALAAREEAKAAVRAARDAAREAKKAAAESKTAASHAQ